VNNMALASANVRNMTEGLAQLASKSGAQQNLPAALTAARRTAESLERTAASLEKLVVNPQFEEDVRKTVSEARAAMEHADRVLERVGKVFGPAGIHTPKVQARETHIDALFQPQDGRFRATWTSTFSLSPNHFLNLGIYSLGGQNKIIVQPGLSIGRDANVRYGLYASKLGGGLDYSFSPKLFSSLDIHDPDDPRADLLLGYRINSDLDIVLGVDRVFDRNRPVVGARLAK
jgi:hypothetical protein